MKQILLFFLAISTLYACGGGSTAAPVSTNLGGYQVENLGTGKVENAIKKTGDGKIAEIGSLIDGKKFGTWITYHTAEENTPIKTITTYKDGLKNGPYMSYNKRGQLELKADYLNDQYHGKYAKYKFGNKVEEEINYSNGQLDGAHKTYYSDGKLQKEINYKAGKQHGAYKYYNEEGKVTLEYMYENGEKVSGGMVK